MCAKDGFVRIQGFNAKLPWTATRFDYILLQLSERSNPFEMWFSILRTTVVGRLGSLAFEGCGQCWAISHFISRLAWKEQQIYTKPRRNLKFIQIQNNFGNPFCGDSKRGGKEGEFKLFLKEVEMLDRNKWKSLEFFSTFCSRNEYCLDRLFK